LSLNLWVLLLQVMQQQVKDMEKKATDAELSLNLEQQRNEETTSKFHSLSEELNGLRDELVQQETLVKVRTTELGKTQVQVGHVCMERRIVYIIHTWCNTDKTPMYCH
jgi:chromosome segregation ATPase